jgi:hypothetical protein
MNRDLRSWFFGGYTFKQEVNAKILRKILCSTGNGGMKDEKLSPQIELRLAK